MESIRPYTRIECEARGAVSKRTCTPGSTVRVTPCGTVTSPVTMNGLPETVHVVFPGNVPDTRVGPATAVRDQGAGKKTRTRTVRRMTAPRRTTAHSRPRYLSSLVQPSVQGNCSPKGERSGRGRGYPYISHNPAYKSPFISCAGITFRSDAFIGDAGPNATR